MAGRLNAVQKGDAPKRVILATDTEVMVGTEKLTIGQVLQELQPHAEGETSAAGITAYALSRLLEVLRDGVEDGVEKKD